VDSNKIYHRRNCASSWSPTRIKKHVFNSKTKLKRTHFSVSMAILSKFILLKETYVAQCKRNLTAFSWQEW
jgi:hypothetical protein